MSYVSCKVDRLLNCFDHNNFQVYDDIILHCNCHQRSHSQYLSVSNLVCAIKGGSCIIIDVATEFQYPSKK